jgi:hypothetical protein
VTDRLRASTTLLDAEAFNVGARLDVLVATAELDRALGRAPAGSASTP